MFKESLPTPHPHLRSSGLTRQPLRKRASIKINIPRLVAQRIICRPSFLTIFLLSSAGQDLSLPPQFVQSTDATLQRQLSAPPEIGLSRQVSAAQDMTFTRQLSTPAPQDLSQQAQQQQYTGNPQFQGPQF